MPVSNAGGPIPGLPNAGLQPSIPGYGRPNAGLQSGTPGPAPGRNPGIPGYGPPGPIPGQPGAIQPGQPGGPPPSQLAGGTPAPTRAPYGGRTFPLSPNARPPTAEASAAASARQADISQNGAFMRPRFDRPEVFQNYARGIGLDPANINSGNFYQTFQDLDASQLPNNQLPNRRAFESGFGSVMGPDFMGMRGDIGRKDVWNYLKTAPQDPSGFGGYMQQQWQEGGPAKPTLGPKVQGQNNPPRRASRGTTFAG